MIQVRLQASTMREQRQGLQAVQPRTVKENGNCAFVVDFRITWPACPSLRSSRTTEVFLSFEAAGAGKSHLMVPCCSLSPPEIIEPHLVSGIDLRGPAIWICMHIAIPGGVRAPTGDS